MDERSGDRSAARGVWRLSALVMLCLVGCRTVPEAPVDPMPSIWPVAAPGRTISSPFGPRNGGFHKGIDIAAPKGTTVTATAPGRVVYAGRDWGSGYGRIVKIDHGNGYETWYAHLKRAKVRRGKRVERGQRIGTVGESGRADGPHVHYEVRKEGQPVNPRSYMH